MTNALLPAPRLDADAQACLDTLTRERILDPAKNADHDLQLFGASVLPRQQTICRTEQGSWLFVDNRDDPTAADYRGKIPVPRAQRERLGALARAGVRPDHIWLAHELPADWGGATLPSLVPAPAPLRQKDDLLLDRVRRAFSAAGTLAAGLGAAVTGGLDPIVLGGVQHPRLPIVSWVILAQWTWE